MNINQPSLFILDYQEVTFSSIAEYLRCPLRYKYIYLDRLNKIKKPSLFFQLGGLLHRIFADYYRTENQLEKTFDFMRNKLINGWKIIRFIDNEEESFWFEKSNSIIKNFLKKVDCERTVFAIEKSFSADFERFIFKGIVDRIDINENQEYEIIDYKLGNEIIEPNLVSYENNLQAFFYYFGVSKSFGIKPRRFLYYLLMPNLYIEVDYYKSDMEKEKQKIINLIDEIKSREEFKPQKNKYCQDCLCACPFSSGRE